MGKGIRKAVLQNDLPQVKRLYRQGHCLKFTLEPCIAANGSDELLNYLIRNGARDWSSAIVELVKCSNEAKTDENKLATASLLLHRHPTFSNFPRANQLFCEAAKEGAIWALELLLAKGVDVNCRDPHDGRTPICNGVAYRRYEAIEWLLKHGADPNQTVQQPTWETVIIGRTALHFAAENWDQTAIEILLAAGADVNVRDRYVRTPLAVMCFSPRVGVYREGAGSSLSTLVDILLEAGAESNPADSRYAPLRMLADDYRNGGVRHAAEVLIQKGADPNAVGSDGRLALHAAREYVWQPYLSEVLMEYTSDYQLVMRAMGEGS